jgi:hypothetical protein
MRESRLALFRGEREEEPGGEHREHTGDEGREDDPEESGQGRRMLSRGQCSPLTHTVLFRSKTAIGDEGRLQEARPHAPYRRPPEQIPEETSWSHRKQRPSAMHPLDPRYSDQLLGVSHARSNYPAPGSRFSMTHLLVLPSQARRRVNPLEQEWRSLNLHLATLPRTTPPRSCRGPATARGAPEASSDQLDATLAPRLSCARAPTTLRKRQRSRIWVLSACSSGTCFAAKSLPDKGAAAPEN